MKTKLIASALIITLTAGCTAMPNRGFGDEHRPIVDLHGKDAVVFEKDLAECQAYARQTASAAQAAMAGALLGALLNAAANKAVTGSGGNRAGAAGAVIGGLAGAGSGETNQRNIIRNCLGGRGYSVLG